MIKIRYSDLQAGLHASAAREGRHTVIDLLPGLSPAERSSAIDRLRASARVGHGPKLPAIPLQLALTADLAKRTTRNAVSAARLHPTKVAIPAVVLASGAILYGLLVTVSVSLGLPATSYLAIGPIPAAAIPVSPGTTTPPAPVPHHRHGAARPAHGSKLTGDQAAGPASPSAGSGHGRKPSPASSSGSPGASPSGSPSPAPSPSRSSSPSPSPSPTGQHGSGLCLNLGLIRICL